MLKITMYASEHRYDEPNSTCTEVETIKEAQEAVNAFIRRNEPEFDVFVACNVYADNNAFHIMAASGLKAVSMEKEYLPKC